MTWLPDGFAHPTRIDIGRNHYFRPVALQDLDRDIAAVGGSWKRLRAIYGRFWGWPSSELSLERCRAELAQHVDEMRDAESYKYVIVDREETRVLGSIYIDQPDDAHHDAVVSWWVIDELVSTEFEASVDELIPDGLNETGPSPACATESGRARRAEPVRGRSPASQAPRVQTRRVVVCIVTHMSLGHREPLTLVPYVAFAAFGAFWGTWGALLPLLRDQAGVTTAELGTALLFIGAGALPAMALAGRVHDKFGPRVSAVPLALLAVSGLMAGFVARDIFTLAGSMVLVGAASGATDVGINTMASEAESVSRRPVLLRSHGVFSASVVAASLGVGGLLEASGGAGVEHAFVVSASVLGLAAVLVCLRSPNASPVSHRISPSSVALPRPRRAVLMALVVVGAVGALAYAIENAFQSWGAVFVADTFAVGPGVAAMAPATFAAVAALARFVLAPLSRSHPTAVLGIAGLIASFGSVVVAVSTSPVAAFTGVGIAAFGAAALFPTLLSQVTRHVPSPNRGVVTSLVAGVAYVGFLAGPACVGLVAGAASLRVALLSVAGIALVFAFTAVWCASWASSAVLRAQDSTELASAQPLSVSSTPPPESEI